MNRYVMMAIVMLTPFLVTACNTMAGAGEDLSKGGQKIQQESIEHKNY